ncbi:hypothetical protein A3765_10550 [Oleiphilus sp. HI0130]|nr:hypothetical protein A3765_18575 [Oleiphilus sp. HI0130]KZZ75254.1 hypothetical protein A3765_10550 [Oleiphilus sp. HI0130]
MFLTHLDVREISGGRWKLLGSLDYLLKPGTLFYKSVIRVPVGFVTDLASIPKALRFLISQNEKHRKAAVLHDYLYYKKGNMDLEIFTRKECDQLFEQAMQNCGVNWLKRKTMYAGVRIGGWYAWSNL